MSYPSTINNIPGINKYLSNVTNYKNAEYIAQSILTLPTHDLVNKSDMDRIIDFIGREVV